MFHVAVSLRNGETNVSVSCGLTSNIDPSLTLRSSDVRLPLLDPATWGQEAVNCLNARLATGAAKGRVLAIWQRVPGDGEEGVAAFLSWHLVATGSLVVFDLAVLPGTDDERRDRLTAVLLAALLEAAAHPSSPVAPEWQSELWWSQALCLRVGLHEGAWRRENQRRGLQAGFVDWTPPPAKQPGHLKHQGKGWVGKST